MSSVSSSSDGDFDIVLFPITHFSDDEDDTENADASDERESESDAEKETEKPKAYMTLRQRRLSKSLGPLTCTLNVNINHTRAHNHWLTAIKKSKVMHDPWAAFHIENMESEVCIRHRYNPHKKTWTKDEVTVKLEKKVSILQTQSL